MLLGVALVLTACGQVEPPSRAVPQTPARSATESTGAAPAAPKPCPKRWGGQIGGWVPAPPGVAGAGESLVPGAPVEAMICAYPGNNTNPGGEQLAGTRTLTETAGQLGRDLGYLPVGSSDGACTAMGGPMTNYLIRFTYADGRSLWVGTAEEVNHCVTTTNGTASSRSYVGDRITAAYRQGTPQADGKDLCESWMGRRGQNERMVPDEPTSVVVCRLDPQGGQALRTEYGTDVAGPLASKLNDLDARPSDNSCQQTKGDDPGVILRLVFGYADGPPAAVMVQEFCRPSVNNGLLQADGDDRLNQEATRLAPR
ncbi:hypothetical protein GCM10023193_73730 [Planotetraspora kaengkrachanensis]|uniref:Uncharacterized protein n=1 Tax=Planotetraspora kaengkrachanensis TaxID=575193 RepID=A0A8J3PZT1_9ACTN|nr:hypothetical protein Pka01_72630 [Planotetraspora kaengkrachanensis]